LKELFNLYVKPLPTDFVQISWRIVLKSYLNRYIIDENYYSPKKIGILQNNLNFIDNILQNKAILGPKNQNIYLNMVFYIL
jgi:hypothetical protein